MTRSIDGNIARLDGNKGKYFFVLPFVKVCIITHYKHDNYELSLRNFLFHSLSSMLVAVAYFLKMIFSKSIFI